MNDKWQEYITKTKTGKPRPLLVEAAALVQEKGEVLDLGSGAMNDAKFLVAAGFRHITAVDKSTPPEDVLKDIPPGSISFIRSTFETFDFPAEKYSLVNAQYALPFNPHDSFDAVFSKIIKSLRPGGIFVGQFFGTRDEWNTSQNQMTFHTEDQARQLLSPLQVIAFTEEEKDAPTALNGQKHWHVFHFIARRA